MVSKIPVGLSTIKHQHSKNLRRWAEATRTMKKMQIICKSSFTKGIQNVHHLHGHMPLCTYFNDIWHIFVLDIVCLPGSQRVHWCCQGVDWGCPLLCRFSIKPGLNLPSYWFPKFRCTLISTMLRKLSSTFIYLRMSAYVLLFHPW